jgi:hypothetical protein
MSPRPTTATPGNISGPTSRAGRCPAAWQGERDVNAVRETAIGELRRMVLDALADHDAAAWLFGSCARDASAA